MCIDLIDKNHSEKWKEIHAKVQEVDNTKTTV